MSGPRTKHTDEELPRRFFVILGVVSIWLMVYVLVHETITARYQAQWAPEASVFVVPEDVAEKMSQASLEALEASYRNGAALLGKCLICHDVSQNSKGVYRFGPPLDGLLESAVAIQPEYDYSPVLKSMSRAGKPWSPQQLAAFIHKPDAFAEGTRMPFPGLDDIREIRDLVHYFAWSSCQNACEDPHVLRIDKEVLTSVTTEFGSHGACRPVQQNSDISNATLFSRDDIVLIPGNLDPCAQ